MFNAMFFKIHSIQYSGMILCQKVLTFAILYKYFILLLQLDDLVSSKNDVKLFLQVALKKV